MNIYPKDVVTTAALGILYQRELDSVIIVNVLFRGLDASLAGSENLVPKSRLFTIIATHLPAFAVMEIMILNDEFPTPDS